MTKYEMYLIWHGFKLKQKSLKSYAHGGRVVFHGLCTDIDRLDPSIVYVVIEPYKRNK
jgi:hypothetical protein